MSDKKFTVHVAKERGHEQELMTRENIVDMVSSNENTWVFVDSQMVSVEELETIELNDATEIRINPGMVGGAETFTVLVASKAGDEAVLMTKQEISDKLTSNNSNWLIGDPCVEGWYGIYCCPLSMPYLINAQTRDPKQQYCSSNASSSSLSPPPPQGMPLCYLAKLN